MGLTERLLAGVSFHQDVYARALGDAVRPGDAWLDLGAGTILHDGDAEDPAELAARASALVGIDLRADHLRENTLLTARLAGSGEELPLASGSFDVVSANMVLEHLPDPARVFREVARVLRPGGRFVFVTPNRLHPVIMTASVVLRPEVRRLLAVRVEGRELDHVFPTYYRANTSGALRRLAVGAGLGVQELAVHRNPPFSRRPRALVLAEATFIAACRAGPLRQLGADIVGVLRKQ